MGCQPAWLMYHCPLHSHFMLVTIRKDDFLPRPMRWVINVYEVLIKWLVVKWENSFMLNQIFKFKSWKCNKLLVNLLPIYMVLSRDDFKISRFLIIVPWKKNAYEVVLRNKFLIVMNNYNMDIHMHVTLKLFMFSHL